MNTIKIILFGLLINGSTAAFGQTKVPVSPSSPIVKQAIQTQGSLTSQLQVNSALNQKDDLRVLRAKAVNQLGLVDRTGRPLPSALEVNSPQ